MNPLRATAGLAATRGAEPLAGMYSEVAINLNQNCGLKRTKCLQKARWGGGYANTMTDVCLPASGPCFKKTYSCTLRRGLEFSPQVFSCISS